MRPSVTRACLVATALALLSANGDAHARRDAGPWLRQSSAPVGTLAGEFAVDANGSANYSIEIQVPPGILGVQPKLAIEYRSQAPPGLLGNGVVLRGLSAINRCEASLRLDGFNGAISFGPDDRFCLDGQRLIKVAGSGPYGAAGSTYHTENETWAKVTAVGSCGSGPCSFVVVNKDGWRLEFGVADSAVPLPNASEIASWQIASTSDLHGNRVSVTYQFDRNTLQNLPIELRYTENPAAGIAGARKVTFEYERRGQSFPRFLGGFSFLVDRRLKTIRTFVDGSEVMQYRFGYAVSAGTERDLLTRIEQCASGRCFPATEFTTQEEKNALKSPNSNGDGFLRANWCTEQGALVGWTDFNGDGRPDVHCDTSAGTHRVLLSTGNGLISPNSDPEGVIRTNWCSGSGMAPYWIDFNGDALADPACNGSDGTHRVLLSDGVRVSSPNGTPDGLVRTNWCGGAGSIAQWGNFNADGRADLLCSSRDGVQRVLLSAGSAVTSPNSNPDGTVRTGWCTDADAVTYWTDFNGDHLADVHCATPTGITRVLLSRSTDLVSPNSDPLGTVKTGWCAGTDRRRGATDFNGDGLIDAYCSGTDGKHWVLLATGKLLVSPNSNGDGLVRSAWCEGSAVETTWADFNGDGLADLQCRDAGGSLLALLSTGTRLRSPNQHGNGLLRAGWCIGAGARTDWTDFNGDGLGDVSCQRGGSLYGLIHEPGAPDLVAKIADGVGKSFDLEYLPLTDSSVYEDGDTAEFPLLDVRSPMYVVSRYVSGDGRGAAYVFRQTYRGARTDVLSQRWLGFQQVTTTEEATGRNTIVSYLQDYPVTAFVTATSITDRDGRLLSRAEYSPVATQPFPHVHQVLVSSERTSTFTNGVPDFVISKTSRHDEFGNLTFQAETSDPYYAVYTCQTFSNDTAKWQLGYPTGSKTTRTADACLAFKDPQATTWNPATDLRWTATEYDAVMNAIVQKSWDDTHGRWIRITRSFDNAGNATSRTDAAGHTTSFTFDPSKTFVASETSPANEAGRRLTMYYTYHPASGAMRTRTDANGNTRLTLVDSFGRPTEVRGPNPTGSSGQATVTLRIYTYSFDTTGRYVEVRDRQTWNDDDPADWHYARAWYDGMGRVFRRAERSTRPGVDIITENLFDTAARDWKQSVPRYSGEMAEYVVTTYDLLNRPVTVTTPDGTVERHEYVRGQLEERTIEAFGTTQQRTTVTTRDPRDLVLRTLEPNGGLTVNEFDAVSQLANTTGPTGSATRRTYDSLGRPVEIQDSDRGRSVRTYDETGQLKQWTGGTGRSIRFDYDALLRPVRKTIETAQGDEIYTFAYDDPTIANSIGNLTTITGPGFRKELAYSPYALVSTEKLTLDNEPYLTSTAYDAQGRAALRTYADGSVLRIARFVNGLPHRFDLQAGGTGPFVNHVTYASYTALGQPETLDAGNGLQARYTYYPIATGMGRPRSTTVSRRQPQGAPLLELGYEWDRLNDLTAARRTRGSDPTEVDIYSYDSMGWLQTAAGPSGNLQFTYDPAGNIKTKDGVTYQYAPNSNRLVDATNGATFGYDGAGNLDRKDQPSGNWRFERDAAGRLRSASRDGVRVETNLYDADDMRLRRDDENGVVSRYVSPDLDVVQSTSSVLLTKYIRPRGAPVVAITATYTPRAKERLLQRQEALRDRLLYNRRSLSGIWRVMVATARALPSMPEMREAGAALGLLCVVAAAGAAGLRRRPGATAFQRRWPAFSATVPFLIAVLLLSDATLAGATDLGPGNGYPTSGTLYFHGDQVESTLLVTNAAGSETSRVSYDPFGSIDERRSAGPDNFRPKFAAKERDPGTKLSYFGARYYDPALGRFLEPDPQEQFSSPYTYAGNNPLSMVDPDGELAFVAVVIIAAIVGAVAGAYFGGAAVNHTLNPFAWDWGNSRTLAGIFAGAAIGAASGAIGALAGGAGVAPGIIADVILGAAENVAFTAMGGGSQKDLLEAALTGAVIGGVTSGIGAGISAAAGSGARAAQRAERRVLSSEMENVDTMLPSVCASFVAGTSVATGDGLRPIQQLKPGTPVLGTTDEATRPSLFPIESAYSREASSFVDVSVGRTTVRATAEHPFWSVDHGWTPAERLAPNDRLLTADGTTVTVTGVRKISTTAAVFNFEVARASTYYVTPLRLLVHNPANCTRGARARMQRRGVDTLNIVGGRRTLRRPARYGAPIRRYGPAAPGLPGGRYVDFGPVAIRTHRIRLTGTNPGDFARVDALAGINKRYRQRYRYVWHHVEDVAIVPGGAEGTMQLVPQATHTAWPHFGGEHRYRVLMGGGYGH